MTLLEKFKGTLVAQNVFLDENTGGKGKYFKARFLQPGLVKYSFGVCVLEKDTIDKFIHGFVGCPVIIGHKDVTSENAKDLSCGNICHIWYDDLDGWYWGDGIIDNDEALELINQGYNVSCQYEITEYANNTTNALHNGNPYDKVILNGKPEHLAIVNKPRYENAMIAVNALDLTEESEETEQTQEVEESITDKVLQAINEIKETDMFKKLFNRKEQQMEKDEMKSLFIECLQECLQAKNEEDDKEDEKKDVKEEEKKEDEKVEEKDDEKAENKCKNEVVDKRDIIRQIMAIAGKEEASEDVKTIAKLAEKLAYEKSEADDKADNEDDKKKEDEAKNKAKNSIEEMKAMFSQSEVKKAASNYITRDDAIALGNELF